MTLQRFFDAGEQIIAADEKFDRLIQHVQLIAERVFEFPGKCDNTLLSDFHRRIVAVHSDGRQRGLFHAMDAQKITPLLGGMSPAEFMRKHWHKKPLLVRQAIPGFEAPIPREELFELAAEEGVESRLIQQKKKGWSMDHGPFDPDSLPSTKTRDWTLLVQGVDLHNASARALLDQFRFVPEARLDDLMISYASNGGGVGPHFDSYDVFLLQVSGQRRWRISAQKDLSLQEGKPLKILQNFEADEEWVLEPGDMLYLPPHCAHDGVAETGDCMTYSVGFRAPTDVELTQEVLLRLGEYLADDEAPGKRFADPKAQATESPGELPGAMLDFAAKALQRVAGDPVLLARALGEVLSDPKPSVQFDGEGLPDGGWAPEQAVVLDRRTRMLHDAKHVFVNGEAFVVGGKDGRLLRQLADSRNLSAREAAGLSEGARAVMEDWIDMGWLHVQHA